MNNYSYASMRDTFDMSAYFVVGPQDCKSRTITGVIEDALRGGATFIQLRAKNTDAKDITSMARDIAQVIENNGKSGFRGVCDRRSRGCSLAGTSQGHQS